MKTRERLFIIETENKTVFWRERKKGLYLLTFLAFGANVKSEKGF